MGNTNGPSMEDEVKMSLNNDLLDAVSDNDIPKVVKLLEAGADIHTDDDSVLRWAVNHGNMKLLKIAIQYGADIHADNDFALRRVSYLGKHKFVKFLLDLGADIHAENDRALWLASSKQDETHYITTQILLDYGADRSRLHSKATTEMREYTPTNPRRLCVIGEN